MHPPSHNHHSRLEFSGGFTLLEMSIVLLIVAALTASVLAMGNSAYESARKGSTNEKLNTIEAALMSYRLTNNRLPCPADPTIVDNATNAPPNSATPFGYEAGVPGNCAYTNGTYTMPNYPITKSSIPPNYAAIGMNAVEGAIPVRTLGLPDEFQFDGWGRKFTYAVSSELTANAATAGSGNQPAFINYGMQANCGAITVKNASHTNRTQVADYVLLSYGPDGHGGYMSNGTRYNVGASMTNADEIANAHFDNTGTNTTYSAIYVQKDYDFYTGFAPDGVTANGTTNDNDATHPFGHILRYKERSQMQNDYDLYHPGSRLPCTQGFAIQGVGQMSSLAVGDINGDGIPDLIIGSRNSSAAYVIFGTRNGFPDPLPISSLNGTNGFELDTPSPYGSQFGASVAVGDINGDGIADIIIGEYGNYLAGNYGHVYVVFGKNTGWPTSPTVLNSGPGHLIDGVQGVQFDGVPFFVSGPSFPPIRDYLGKYVNVGDVNGDGIADLIIGAHSSAYVVFGKSGGWNAPGGTIALDNSFVDGRKSIRLDTPINDFLSVAAGDFNGDGIADIIIGDGGASPHGLNSGSTYVVFGKNTTNTSFLPNAAAAMTLNVGPGNLIDGTHGVRFDGTNPADSVGSSVTTGDINGDGVADLIIGAINASPNGILNAGSTYVIFGKSKSWGAAGNISLALPSDFLSGTLINGATGVRFDGVTIGSGSSSVVAGDVNGDGYADIIIDAAGAVNGGLIGSAYVIFGKSTSWGNAGSILLNSGTLIDGTHGTRLDGNAGDDGMGKNVATGDINGDGIPDIIMGAPHISTVFIYNGRAAGWLPSYNLGNL